MRYLILLVFLTGCSSMSIEERSRANTEQLMKERARDGHEVYTHEEWMKIRGKWGWPNYEDRMLRFYRRIQVPRFPTAHLRRTR